jgi:hypothetical protein
MVVVLLPAVATLAASPEADRCGHVRELERARAALEQGDRGAALLHLRRANVLLKGCQERLPERPPRSQDLSAAAVG